MLVRIHLAHDLQPVKIVKEVLRQGAGVLLRCDLSRGLPVPDRLGQGSFDFLLVVLRQAGDFRVVVDQFYGRVCDEAAFVLPIGQDRIDGFIQEAPDLIERMAGPLQKANHRLRLVGTVALQRLDEQGAFIAVRIVQAGPGRFVNSTP